MTVVRHFGRSEAMIRGATPRMGKMRSRLIRRCIDKFVTCALAVLCTILSVAPQAAHAQNATSFIRGALLGGKFRTDAALAGMTPADQRNTLIVELANHTANDVRFYQKLSDNDLAGVGGLMIFLRESGGRSDAELKRMTADDVRNTAIVALAAQTGQSVPQLQVLNNLQLMQQILGPQRAWIRGVLLAGHFRTQKELNRMSGEDQRNTLIVELTGRTASSTGFYQGLNDTDLAGAGALLVYLRHTASRSDAALKQMTADGIRNTAIIQVHAWTRRADLQSLSNIQLARIILGSPKEVRDPANLPELAQPGRHTILLRVNRSFTNNTLRSFSDVPFIGTFTGRGTDCSHGLKALQTATGSGKDFVGVAGWGQVEGDGHPGSNSDQCASWVYRLGVDFDLAPFTSLPVVTRVESAVLTYREEVSPSCIVLVYTQGGFLVDSLPCWTNGEGRPEAKPAGCLTLRLPSVDWFTRAQANTATPDTGRTFQKLAPRAWDVTSLFNERLNPPLSSPSSPSSSRGIGYMFTGAFTSTGGLDANDNTRCTSVVSDVSLEVTYTVPPQQPVRDPEVIR